MYLGELYVYLKNEIYFFQVKGMVRASERRHTFSHFKIINKAVIIKMNHAMVKAY